MNKKQWNFCVEFLSNQGVGAFVSENNRKVEIVDMCGGRYLLFEDGEVCGVVETVLEAVRFLDRR